MASSLEVGRRQQLAIAVEAERLRLQRCPNPVGRPAPAAEARAQTAAEIARDAEAKRLRAAEFLWVCHQKRTAPPADLPTPVERPVDKMEDASVHRRVSQFDR